MPTSFSKLIFLSSVFLLHKYLHVFYGSDFSLQHCAVGYLLYSCSHVTCNLGTLKNMCAILFLILIVIICVCNILLLE